MKVTVLQEHLVKALATAGRIVSARPQMPILSHVLLATRNGGLELSATNLEIGWRTVVAATVEGEGIVAVPVGTLLELVGNVGAGRVTLEVVGQAVKVTGVGLKASVNGSVADEFPVLPKYMKEQAVELPAEVLRESFGRVVFAAATDESRPVLTAVLLRIKRGNLELVGTDGFRLSLVKLEANMEKEEEKEWLVPAKSILELSRLIDEGIESVGLSTVEQGNQVVFSLGETELSSRLVSGTYPDYRKILPEEGESVARMDREEFLRAMKLAAVFARESSNIVKLEVREAAVLVMANAAAVGENEVAVEARVSGPGGRIAFNYRYVLDYLNVVSAKEVILEMSGSLDPGLWRGGEKDSFVLVIMPVRLEEEG